MKTLTTEFTIKNGRLIAQLDTFLLANEGKEGELKLKIVNTDKVMYWRQQSIFRRINTILRRIYG